MSIVSPRPDDPAANAATLLDNLGFALLFVAAPVGVLFYRRALFVLLPVGAVLLLIGLIMEAPWRGLERLRRGLATPLGGAALFLIGWTALSLIWTPFHVDANARFVKAMLVSGAVTLVAAYMPPRTAPLTLYLLPLGVCLAAAGCLIGWFAGLPGFHPGVDIDSSPLLRAVLTAVLLAWPALAALTLYHRWLLSGALAIIVAAAAIVAATEIALSAMAAGALMFAIAMTSPARVPKLAAWIVAPLILAAPLLPLLVQVAFKTTGYAALIPAPISFWSGLVIGDWPRLITGHGLDATIRGIGVGILPAETPRSILFEIWYDLGVLGAVGFAAVMALAFRAVGRAPQEAIPAVLGGFTAGLTIAISGLETAQLWWITLICLDAIAFAAVLNGMHRQPRLDARGIDALPEV